MTIVVLMGVAGCGKTTIGKALGDHLGWLYQEGDDLHPAENVARMRAGTPLTDKDRWPWLAAIAGVIDQWREEGESGVVACSALKRAYRDILIGQRPDVQLVYLKGDRKLIEARMALREDHFMPVALLDSQFATLEPPAADEYAITIPIGGTVEAAVEKIIKRLASRTARKGN